MRALVQRVSEARVRVEGEVVGEIQAGLLVLVGVGQEDDAQRAAGIVRSPACAVLGADQADRVGSARNLFVSIHRHTASVPDLSSVDGHNMLHLYSSLAPAHLSMIFFLIMVMT